MIKDFLLLFTITIFTTMLPIFIYKLIITLIKKL